jgi:hypothetical protein
VAICRDKIKLGIDAQGVRRATHILYFFIFLTPLGTRLLTGRVGKLYTQYDARGDAVSVISTPACKRSLWRFPYVEYL